MPDKDHKQSVNIKRDLGNTKILLWYDYSELENKKTI